jgi:hypothetical protein
MGGVHVQVAVAVNVQVAADDHLDVNGGTRTLSTD